MERRSLDANSAATLVHAFVASRVDYCNAILTGVPKSITDELQRTLNAAARVVSNTRKYDHGLSHLLHEELHWLDVPQRAQFKLSATVRRCLQSRVPQYLPECCILFHKSFSSHRLPSSLRTNSTDFATGPFLLSISVLFLVSSLFFFLFGSVRQTKLAHANIVRHIISYHIIPHSDIAHRQHLRSAICHQLFVPRHQRSMFGLLSFSVAGLMAWNLLPDSARDPTRSLDGFWRDSKNFSQSTAYTTH